MNGIDPSNESTFKEIVVPSDLRSAKRPEDRIIAEAQACGYAKEQIFAIKLALEEAMTNAVKHGNRHDKSKTITVRYAVTATETVVIVRDQGNGFTPGRVPDPTQPDRLPIPSGRGIMLMKAYMDEVRYRKNGTEVFFILRNKKDGADE